MASCKSGLEKHGIYGTILLSKVCVCLCFISYIKWFMVVSLSIKLKQALRERNSMKMVKGDCNIP